TRQEAARQLDAYRSDLADLALYDFGCDDYCAWSMEPVKPPQWDETASAERQRGTRRTLVTVLEAILRLAHPFMPFITEEIWQRVAPLAGTQADTIMLAPFPLPQPDLIDSVAEADAQWLKEVIAAIRNIRGEMRIPPGKALPLYLHNGGE